MAVDLVFHGVNPTLLNIVNSSRVFPVHRVFCIGRNYKDHAEEMKADTREPPFFFMKSASCVVPTTTTGLVPIKVSYPPSTSNLHFEAELVVTIDKTLSSVSPDVAASAIFGYAMGVDLTRRDLQDEAKKLSRPWCTSKSFDQSAPISAILPVSDFPHHNDLSSLSMSLTVNNVEKQNTKLGMMIWSAPEMISKLSNFYTLLPGDIIMTGTPAGVGPLVPTDTVVATCDSLPSCSFTIA